MSVTEQPPTLSVITEYVIVVVGATFIVDVVSPVLQECEVPPAMESILVSPEHMAITLDFTVVT